MKNRIKHIALLLLLLIGVFLVHDFVPQLHKHSTHSHNDLKPNHHHHHHHEEEGDDEHIHEFQKYEDSYWVNTLDISSKFLTHSFEIDFSLFEENNKEKVFVLDYIDVFLVSVHWKHLCRPPPHFNSI